MNIVDCEIEIVSYVYSVLSIITRYGRKGGWMGGRRKRMSSAINYLLFDDWWKYALTYQSPFSLNVEIDQVLVSIPAFLLP